MKCFVGIDLGSTTTKAVVLDGAGKILGRGITNSRSNYDVACEVARSEAFTDTRFQLFGETLGSIQGLADMRESVLGSLRQELRLAQHLHLLVELESACRICAEKLGERVPARARAALDPAFADLFAGLRGEAERLFASDARPRSDFFRDIAGATYMSLAESAARTHKLDYELLVGIYDKAIITIESHVPTADLKEMIQHALVRATARAGVPTAIAAKVERGIEEVLDLPLSEAMTVGTGYGRARLPFPKERIRSEILCHGLGAHASFPNTRTVLDIGGQDTKAIQIDGQGIVTSFQMNDRCAAGCGRYLGYIADEMNLGLQELGPLALTGRRPVRINSTCTVFAGAELRDRLAMGQRREDILAGLHRAIILRAMSLLARSGGVREEFTFTGGVAKNAAALKALRALVAENYGERTINVSSDSIYTGALGAALFALRAGPQDAAPEPLEAAASGGAA